MADSREQNISNVAQQQQTSGNVTGGKKDYPRTTVNPFDIPDSALPVVNILPSSDMDEFDDDLIETKCLDDTGRLGDGTYETVSLDSTASIDQVSLQNIPVSGEGRVGLMGDNIPLDAIAARLIKERLVLTALELHMELIESGRELSRLRDFFSNPSNFERTRIAVNEGSPPPTTLARTSSVQTFDSLDFARYSDDGERNESDRIAVLEFDLRKAQDTIKSLRAALTKSAETEVAMSADSVDEGGGKSFNDSYVTDEPIRPHERRTINFLVNEHLLRCGYKLTAVTFSEENESQNFEDWDDVGINMAKPPDLVKLYRDYGQHLPVRVATKDVECATDIDNSFLQLIEANASDQFLQPADERNAIKKQEISYHMANIEESTLSSEEQSGDNSEADNVVGRESTIDSCISENQGTKRKDSTVNDSNRQSCESVTLVAENSCSAVADLHTSASLSSPTGKPDCATPGQFENNVDKEDRNDASVEVDQSVADGKSDQNDNTLLTDDKVLHLTNTICDQNNLKVFDKWQPTSRSTSNSFLATLLSAALHRGAENSLTMSTADDSNVIMTLGHCLPRVIPNVLLARRDELIPLIVLAATLHPEPSCRDALLHELFNLIKRPDADQRRMILTGCVVFAQHAGAARVSSELLPQCWEQIEHKHAERRLLVAEACGALAPYIPNDMRGSLVLSILQQMLDDKTEEVREAVVRSLGALVGWIDAEDKFTTISGLLISNLCDSCERVAKAVLDILLPSVAVWASELGQLESNIVQTFVDALEKCARLSSSSSSDSAALLAVITDMKRFNLYAQTLQQLVPFLLLDVIQSGPFADKADDEEAEPVLSGMGDQLPEAPSDLLDVNIIVGSSAQFLTIFTRYERYISEEWFEPWHSFSWLSREFIPQLLQLTVHLEASESIVRTLSNLFQLICRSFGRTFTISKVLPQFQQTLGIATSTVPQLCQPLALALYRSTAAIYGRGILTAFALDDDKRRLQTFLTDFIRAIAATKQMDLTSLRVTFSELSSLAIYQEMLLRVLWEAVVDATASVRIMAGQLFDAVIKGGITDQLIASRVVPALVTLASDAEIPVRVATVSALGTIAESAADRTLLEKVYMQFQTFMDDPVYRSTGEQYMLYVELIKTFGRIGPTSEPKFRDEFILPRLTALAAENKLTVNEKRKTAVALQLFETFTALSCCFVNDQLVQEVMLPGLRFLLQDLQVVAPDHVGVVTSMIREFEDRITDSTYARHGSSGMENSTGSGADSGTGVTGEVMKSKVLSRFKDVKDRASHSNFSKMFAANKK